MDEFSFIDSIKQSYYKQAALKRGIGDDAAVFHIDEDIVAATDTFVEDIHFSRSTMQPFHIGYRALAANISDMAAMGARPMFYLVSIVIPTKWPMEGISAIFSGMDAIASQYQMDLIGGDTVSGKELAISITVIGSVPDNRARYRHDAKSGDIVFVTGTLGDSQAGLYLLSKENASVFKDADYFILRHRMPAPRVEFSLGLQKLNRVSLNDVSDGIANEANEIAEASSKAIVLYDDLIPIHSSLQQFPKEHQFQWKYFGGEDFELIGTVPEKDWPLVQEIADNTKTKVTKIGMVFESEEPRVYYIKNNKKQKLYKHGYKHLK